MSANEPKRFYRDMDNKMIWGVCSGVAKYFNIDVTLVRVIWLVATVCGFGTGLVLYVVIALVAPKA